MHLSRLCKISAIVFFVFVISSFLMLEAVFRIYPPFFNVQPTPVFYGNKLGNLKPNLNASAFWHPRIPYRYSTDSSGFRKNGRPLHASPEKLILCLGNSYTFGVSVPDDSTFPSALETMLNAKSESNKAVFRVVNSGSPDTGIEDLYLYYIDKARKIKPNLVIVQFDIYNISLLSKPYRYKFSTQDDNTYSFLTGWSQANDIALSLKRNLERFQVYTALSALLFDTSSPRNDTSNTAIASQFLEERKYQTAGEIDSLVSEDKRILEQKNVATLAPLWERYRDVLLKLKNSVEADGIDFLLVLVPHHAQMNSFDNATSSEIAPFCENNNIKVVDLTDKFRSLTRDGGLELYYQPFDIHCNAFGNAVIANEIAKRIQIYQPDKTASFTKNIPGLKYGSAEKITLVFDSSGNPSLSRTSSLEIVSYRKSNITVRREGDGSIEYVTSADKQIPLGTATLELRVKTPVDQIGAVFFPHILDGDNRRNSFAFTLSANGEESTFSTSASHAPERWKDLENLHHLILKPTLNPIETITLNFIFVRDGGFFYEQKGSDSFRRFELLLYPSGAL